MPILIIDVLRALWALRRDPGSAALGLLAAIAIVGGSVFYFVVEDLGGVDAVFLTVTTLTTIGYGDPAPQTDAGKIFTCAFAIFGIGILLAFFTALATQIRRQSVLHRPLGRFKEQPKTGSADTSDAYDVLVIGSDSASRETAVEAARAGLRVVVADSAHVLVGLRTDSAISPMQPAPLAPTLGTYDRASDQE